MTRRAAPTVLLATLLVLGVVVPAQGARPQRTMAITVDDLPFITDGMTPDAMTRATTSLIAGFRAVNAPAIGFVNEYKLHPGGDGDVPADEQRVDLLRQWLDADLDLGNHTFGHDDVDTVGVAAYEQSILDGEEVLRPLLAGYGQTPRYFRHPYLSTGRSRETQDEVESFLAAHGYRIAPVTVDNSDWIFGLAYHHALVRGDRALARRVGTVYVGYMQYKLLYWERQSRALLGREPAQILLIHASELNADRFVDVARAMRRHGYRFVSLDEALADPLYAEPDTFTGDSGISWLHRWAISHGKDPLPEPTTPRWILQLAGVDHE